MRREGNGEAAEESLHHLYDEMVVTLQLETVGEEERLQDIGQVEKDIASVARRQCLSYR